MSHLYRTRAVGPVQPDFLNAALRVGVPLDPVEFLDELLAIERAHGRVRRERWGPRTLDLDLLWVADVHMESQRLRIPHPELTRRAFAILPLLDVAPDAADPVTGVRYRQVAETLPESGAQRLSNASWAGPFPHAPGSRGGGWT